MAYVLLELKLGGGPWIGCTRADEIERRRLGSSGDRIGRLGSRSSGGQRWSVVCDDWQREGARGYNPWTAFTTTSGLQQTPGLHHLRCSLRSASRQRWLRWRRRLWPWWRQRQWRFIYLQRQPRQGQPFLALVLQPLD
jgi:hypothetical protein